MKLSSGSTLRYVVRHDDQVAGPSTVEGLESLSTTSWVFAIGGSGLYTWGFIWSMYGVMDRY